MFTQKFKHPTRGIIEITWREGIYYPVALMVGGAPRAQLNDATKQWADLACGQRMAEIGEHAEEPK